MSEFVLYSYFRSSASYRARIALNLKKISYEYRAVHLLKNGGEQHDPKYRALNPMRQVPTLIHGDRVLGQSMAIIEYLDAIVPEPPLFPKDPYQRALVIQACEIVNSGIQPIHNTGVLQKLGQDFGADDQAKNAWTRHFIRNGLEALETFLKPHAGDFAFGQYVSAADCFLAPNFANADRFEVSITEFAALSRIRKHLDTIEAFRKASPKAQPDTPAELR